MTTLFNSQRMEATQKSINQYMDTTKCDISIQWNIFHP